MPKLVRSVVSLFVTAIAIGLAIVLIAPSGAVQANSAPQASAQAPALAVQPLLNADGTLDTTQSASGALDLHGWNVALDPKRGPVLSRANAAPMADENWSPFEHGFNNDVNIIAISGSDIYVGGNFTEVCGNDACNSGNLLVNNIARWDGSQWHALGHGVNDGVYGILINGNDVYIGGYFLQLCGNDACNSGNTTMNRIVRWDGSQFHALGHGLSRDPYVIVSHGNDLYIGGYFTQACGNDACDSGNLTMNGITRWDGSQWHPLGHGLSGRSVNSAVTAIQFVGNNLYAGGGFTQICGNDGCDSGNAPIHNVGWWDGSQWHALGYGVDNTVYQFGVIGNDLYMGGDFGQLCGNAACDSGNTRVNYITRWDGSQFNTVANGLNGPVYDMQVSGSDLYVVGRFTAQCADAACSSTGATLNRTARWDGSQWHPLGHGVDANGYVIRLNGTDVYVGGSFTHICGNDGCSSGNITANRIAKLTLTPTQTGPTFVVNTNADTDDGFCSNAGQGPGNAGCSLREAINAANAHSGFDTIHFANNYSILLSSALPKLTDDVTIDGETHSIVLDGDSSYRILQLDVFITLYLNRLTLQNGWADTALTLGSSGAAIYNGGGSLNVTNSTFINNNVLDKGGAILGDGDTNISNSTFETNTAQEAGGSVYGTVGIVLKNSTLAYGESPSGAGVYSAQFLTLINTIIAYSSGPDCTSAGSITSEKNNVLQSTGANACGLVNGTNGDKIGVDPKLGGLANNGGVTRTYALLSGSPALDTGDNATCAADPINNLDQRGMARPKDGDGNGSVVCDIGAYEAPQVSTATPTRTQTRTPTKTSTAASATPTRTNTPTRTPTKTSTAVNATPTRTSTPTATTAACTTKPSKPTLKKPANGATVTQNKVKLDWSDVTCATDYQITVKNADTNKTVFKGIETKSKTKTGGLPPGNYKWSVKARNAFGTSRSANFKFSK